jgi:hypothetical protein
MRHLGQQRSERQDQADLAGSGQLQNQVAVGLPAQVGLDGHPDDHVPGKLRGLGDGEFGGRPGDLALRLRARLEAHVWPGQAEVVELLGVDLGEFLGVKGRTQVPDRRGRRLGGVVPAPKRHDQDRPAKPGRAGVYFQGIHRVAIGPLLFDVVMGSLARTAD